MNHKTFSLGLLATAALLMAGSASAQYTIQLGAAYLDPGSSASATTGPLTPANALSLKVQPQSTVFFSVAREINDNWDLQLALGYPPTHDVQLKLLKTAGLPASVVAADGQKIGTVRQIAPTLFANYKFGAASDTLRPFVGVGINYTMFDEAKSNDLNNSLNGGITNSKLTDSWGLAAQVGATYKLGGPWSLTGVFSTADVKTTLTTNTLGIERKTDVKFNPSVFTLAVGYSF